MSAPLALLQLVSPALPVGAFSYSEGLEVLVQRGQLASPQDVGDWLEAELRQGVVRLETAALEPMQQWLQQWQTAAEAEAEAQLRDLDGWLLAQREALELRQQQRQMGRSLLQLLAELGWPLPNGALDLSWPAAWCWAGCCLGVEAEALRQGYLFSWVANQISAAVRLVPLGPTQGQRLQLALAPVIDGQAKALAGVDPHQLWSSGVGQGWPSSNTLSSTAACSAVEPFRPRRPSGFAAVQGARGSSALPSPPQQSGRGRSIAWPPHRGRAWRRDGLRPCRIGPAAAPRAN